MSEPWLAHRSLLIARGSRCSRLSPTGTFLENHRARRLNFKRSLADTTAESYASVKHTDHIDQLRLLLMLGGSVENWVVQTSFGSTGSARSGRRKGGPRLSFPARGGSSQAGSAGVRQRLKISNDCAGYHLFEISGGGTNCKIAARARGLLPGAAAVGDLGPLVL